MVAVIADLEEVLASLGEAVAVIETLRPKVLRPDPEPRGTRTDPVEDELNEGGAEAGLLVIGKEVEAFELAVFGEDVGVGEAAGPSEGVAHEGAVVLDDPGGVVGVGEEDFVFLQVVGLVEEGCEVGGVVEVAEGLRERGDRQFDEGFGVVGPGAADRRHGDRIGEGIGVTNGVGNL
ncbi:hypothetical protein BJP05_00395 [Corynebacterium sp. NML98-0116]|nr:hypothetical protein BJP05_00395 [Corynebacterium sp. NML98-0116]